MKLFGKKEQPKAYMPSRVSKLSTHDLSSWGGTIIMQLGQAFDNWQYHDGPHEEVSEALSAFSSVWEELSERHHD